jgi:RNA recognition motif-containing protein
MNQNYQINNQATYLGETYSKHNSLSNIKDFNNCFKNPSFSIKNGSSTKGPSYKHQIFVGGITCKTKRAEIEEIFSTFGKVVNIKFIRNKQGATKGYCFVSFSNSKGVENAVNSDNIWLRNRLLSIRRMKVGSQLQNFQENKADTRLTVYGFDKNISCEDSQAYREFFSSLGKLEFYYFVKMRCDKVQNEEISKYIEENNLMDHEFDKVNLLNISYIDVDITNLLKERKVLKIHGKELTISHITTYKKLEPKDTTNVNLTLTKTIQRNLKTFQNNNHRGPLIQRNVY